MAPAEQESPAKSKETFHLIRVPRSLCCSIYTNAFTPTPPCRLSAARTKLSKQRVALESERETGSAALVSTHFILVEFYHSSKGIQTHGLSYTSHLVLSSGFFNCFFVVLGTFSKRLQLKSSKYCEACYHRTNPSFLADETESKCMLPNQSS